MGVKASFRQVDFCICQPARSWALAGHSAEVEKRASSNSSSRSSESSNKHAYDALNANVGAQNIADPVEDPPGGDAKQSPLPDMRFRIVHELKLGGETYTATNKSSAALAVPSLSMKGFGSARGGDFCYACRDALGSYLLSAQW